MRRGRLIFPLYEYFIFFDIILGTLIRTSWQVAWQFVVSPLVILSVSVAMRLEVFIVPTRRCGGAIVGSLDRANCIVFDLEGVSRVRDIYVKAAATQVTIVL